MPRIDLVNEIIIREFQRNGCSTWEVLQGLDIYKLDTLSGVYEVINHLLGKENENEQ